MKSPPGGDQVPNATLTFLIANQGVGANAAFTIGPVACNGARVANSALIASPRVAGPLTAGGAGPVYRAICPADDTVSVLVSNNNANAIVATGADVLIDVLAFPITP